MPTHSTKPSEITRTWHVIDASSQTLGRVATQVARLLMGKHKPLYAPHIDTGDHVIVINAAKVLVTGKKTQQKIYYGHSQYPGGLKSTALSKTLATFPTRVFQHAVRGMLPKNSLGRAMFRKLKVYPGASHPHQAQVPASQQEG